MNVLTRAEIGDSIATGAELASRGSMPDPRSWEDLVAAKEASIGVIQRRLQEERTPLVSQVFRWPKETGGWRQMVWLDPLDQIIFRGVVGRLIPGIQDHVDRDNVFSSQLEAWPPRWRLVDYRIQTGARREKGLELLERWPVLGLIDIKNFYPSVGLGVLERVLGRLTIDDRSFAFLVGWLRQLKQTYNAPGLPTGHDPSRLLADGILVDCDRVLARTGIPFIRYVDDTWFFIEKIDEFEEVVTRYSEALATIGLEIQPLKTMPLTGFEATNHIQDQAIAYFGDQLSTPGPEGLSASLELFDYAMEGLPHTSAALRRAINNLQTHRSLKPLEVLREDLELLRYAPDHWPRYLHTLSNQKDTRKELDDDWMIEQAERHWNNRNEMYKTLVFLRAMSSLQLTPERGEKMGSLLQSSDGRLVPVRVWSSHVWGASEAYPNEAIEILEASGDYSTRRSLALTLSNRRGHKDHRKRVDRVRRLDSELAPTVRWLES